MERQTLLLCGKEEVYVKRMHEFILTVYNNDFDVVLFTSEDGFKKYISEKSADLILIEEGFDVGILDKDVIKIILSEQANQKGTIYKYLPCDKIIKLVMEVCAETKSKREVEESINGKSVIGVYTPIKRCFQTTFALTLGQILAKKHKVLYLNFESYSGFDMLCRSIGNKDMMDLVYFSECSDGDFMMRVNSMKEHIGELDYIFPTKSFLKYSEVSRDQWERLIDNLLSKTEYEYIILDLSEQVNGLLNILQKCTNIYTITDSERISSAKVAQYENLLRASAYEDILEKTENVTVPKFREIPTDFAMLPYSELADYIKRIIDYDHVESECGNE